MYSCSWLTLQQTLAEHCKATIIKIKTNKNTKIYYVYAGKIKP